MLWWLEEGVSLFSSSFASARGFYLILLILFVLSVILRLSLLLYGEEWVSLLI